MKKKCVYDNLFHRSSTVTNQFFRFAPPTATKHLSSEWRTMCCHLEERCILALFPFHPTAMRTRH